MPAATSFRAKALQRAAAELPRSFGKRLQQLRNAAGVSQSTLAAAAGVSLRSMTRWECGVGLPPAATMLQLAAALELEPARLLGYA
jgi:transcriptional regulator with XRE-family HTH domain